MIDGFKDGLVTPPVWGFTADLLKKRPKFEEIMEIASKYYKNDF